MPSDKVDVLPIAKIHTDTPRIGGIAEHGELDIVERLRNLGAVRAGGTSSEPNYDPDLLDCMYSAADEIERLRDDLDYCRREMEAVWNHVQEVSPWSESNDMHWSHEVGTGIHFLVQELSKLRERVEKAPVVTLSETVHGPGGSLEIDEIDSEATPELFRRLLDKRVRLVVEEG